MKTFYRVLFAVAVVLSIAGGFFIPEGEIHGWWGAIPGFFALFGFIGCVLLIVIAKFLGGLFLYQREDYYDDGK